MTHTDDTRKLTFDKLPASGLGSTELYRAKILGGWLVAVYSGEITITFVPDPQHAWDGLSQK